MSACPGTACPRYIGQGCRCAQIAAAEKRLDTHKPGEPIDMRDADRRDTDWYLDVET